MAINYANIMDTQRIAGALKQIDVLPEIFTFFPIPGGDAIREVQYDFLKVPNATRIVDDYDFIASRCELYTANIHQYLCLTTVDFLLRDFNLQTGNEGKLPQLTIQKLADKHAPHRAEYCIMGDAKLPNVEGICKASGTDTLESPSSCETTAGTAETPGGIYTDIADAWPLGGAAAIDIGTAMKRFAIMKMLYHNRDNDIVCLMHPIAQAILKGANSIKIAGTATVPTTVSQDNALMFYKNAGIRIYSFECADSDYVGADAGTTQFIFLANPKENLLVGVGKTLTVDPWWDNEDHSQKRGRISEALVPIALPPYKDTSDDYFKPVVHITTTPWS